MTKRTDQEPGARVLYTTGCGAMRAAMCLRKLATSSCHMFALSYLAAGRDKDPSMTDAAPSLHSAVGQLFGRLLVVYHRQISRFTAFSEV